MKYFITVKDKDGRTLHLDTPHQSIDAALAVVSSEYLTDPDIPFRWTGYFAARDGQITWLKITGGTAGDYLRDDIAEIDILSERGLLERDTDRCQPDRDSQFPFSQEQ